MPKCQVKFVERIDNDNTSNALNALMIRKKCRLQLSPEGIYQNSVPDPADHPAFEPERGKPNTRIQVQPT